MRYNQLGHSALKVSQLCLGTMTWGAQNSEAEAHNQIEQALAAGINFIDTAEMYSVPPKRETYGLTETYLGNWLGRNKKSRNKLVIATKIASRSPRFPYIRPHIDTVPRLDKRSVYEACDASLKRLQTDYIDLYQIHWPERTINCFGLLRYRSIKDDGDIPFHETLEALGDLVQQGKIRHIGLSNDSPWGVMHALQLADKFGLPRVVSVQNPYSLLNRSYEVGLAEISLREGCGLLAYSPLGFGMLSGKYENGARPEGARLSLYGDTMLRYQGVKAQQATSRYVALARAHGLDPAMMALAFVQSQDFMSSCIIGATQPWQIEAALKSTEIKLDPVLLAALDAIDDESPFPAP